jgi:integrase
MILLGINGGLGNTDCATLPLSALNLETGWLDFPRIKTGIERKISLWSETIEALKDEIGARRHPADKEYERIVFITRLGQPWVRFELSETKNKKGKIEVAGKADDAIAKLLKELGIYRKGVTFYALRHTFETIAGGCRDQVAVDAVMGHVDASMAAEYREHIEDERLKAVIEHVRARLFGKPAVCKKTAPKKKSQLAKPGRHEEMPLRVVG